MDTDGLKAKVGDLEVRYRLYGRDNRAHPLVMIMGLGASLDVWEPVTLRLLARDFRVLVFDNRDAGGTVGPPSPAPYTIRDMAEDTLRLMDHFGFGRAHVVGVSMGGMIAQELALAHPDRLGRLVLACTTPGFRSGVAPSDAVAQALSTAGRKDVPAWNAALQLARVTLAPGWPVRHFWRLPGLWARTARWPVHPEAYARQLAAIAEFEAGDRLTSLKVPTLVIHGDRDILLPPDNARRLADLIPGARLAILKGAAHGLTTERPVEFARMVRDFLLEPEAAARRR